MGVNIRKEADRCMNCKKPRCQMGCPVHTPIPQMIQLFKENRLMEAGKELFANNPMSVVCASVCNHGAQCAGNCVLGRKGSPVQFYEIEKYISDTYLDRMLHPTKKKERPQRKGKAVAVIGSGPAGITVAVTLAKGGYDVTVFEERNRIGGMLRYGIPEFRLPDTVLDRYRKLLIELGVKIRPHTGIGMELTIEDLFRDGYATVFIGSGTWRAKTLGIKGESLANVTYGISFLANPPAYDLGETVAVIGMGNVAMDVARTAFRNGAQKVLLFSRDDSITASSHEVEFATMDGAEFVFRRAIDSITTAGPVFKKSILDENGKIVGYEEETELVPADSVIVAVSQGPKTKIARTTHDLEVNERGLVIVDENQMTTRAGVFAAGDCVTGSKTVVHAVEGAKLAAQKMMEYMEQEI